MVLVEGFDKVGEREGSVVVGLYVHDIVISNDGYAFVELTPGEAELAGSYITAASEKVEGL